VTLLLCSLQFRTLSGDLQMTGLGREQLLALKHQLEEDYRLDLDAIGRIQRRFIVSAPNRPADAPSARTTSFSQAPPAPRPELEVQAQPNTDELTDSLRAMFSNGRK
jgi:hypothetical protein